jgi:hypothetical protein
VHTRAVVVGRADDAGSLGFAAKDEAVRRTSGAASRGDDDRAPAGDAPPWAGAGEIRGRGRVSTIREKWARKIVFFFGGLIGTPGRHETVYERNLVSSVRVASVRGWWRQSISALQFWGTCYRRGGCYRRGPGLSGGLEGYLGEPS